MAVVGIGFAALLMYMQIGFQSGLLSSATTFYETLNADLILISPGTLNSGNFQQFPNLSSTTASVLRESSRPFPSTWPISMPRNWVASSPAICA